MTFTWRLHIIALSQEDILGICCNIYHISKQGSQSLLTARMARDMSDKEILKMELEQLKKEVNTPRTPVSKQCLALFFHIFSVVKNLCNIIFKTLSCLKMKWKKINIHINIVWSLHKFVSVFPLNNRWVQTVQIRLLLLRECYQMIRWSRAFQMTRTPTRETREAA